MCSSLFAARLFAPDATASLSVRSTHVVLQSILPYPQAAIHFCSRFISPFASFLPLICLFPVAFTFYPLACSLRHLTLPMLSFSFFSTHPSSLSPLSLPPTELTLVSVPRSLLSLLRFPITTMTHCCRISPNRSTALRSSLTPSPPPPPPPPPPHPHPSTPQEGIYTLSAWEADTGKVVHQTDFEQDKGYAVYLLLDDTGRLWVPMEVDEGKGRVDVRNATTGTVIATSVEPDSLSGGDLFDDNVAVLSNGTAALVDNVSPVCFCRTSATCASRRHC